MAHPHIFAMINEVLNEEKDLKIVALCDPKTPEYVKKAQEKIHGVSVYNSEQELYSNEKFDIVMSSAIGSDKGGIAIRALSSNKSIMFDKPLVTTTRELDIIVSLIKDNTQLKIMLWLTCRYSDSYYTVKKLIESGEIGEVVHLYFVRPHRLAPSTRPDWMFNHQMYGGIINDIGVHDLDLARWYTKSECKEILSATTSNTRFPEYDINDNGSVFIKMENGAEAMVFENWLTPDAFPSHGDTRVSITGTKGTIEKLAFPKNMVKLVTDKQPPQDVLLTAPKLSSVQDFVLSLKNQEYNPLVTTYDAIMATRLALEAQKIADTKNSILL